MGFFTPHQRDTVAAAMARIIPTDDTAGATEAGTVDFIDKYLSGIDHIYAKPDGSGFQELQGKRAEAWWQRINILRQKYDEGIADMDRRSNEAHGGDFVDLTAEQQDQVLTAMEQPEREVEEEMLEAKAVSGFAPVEPALQQTSHEIQLDFFPLLALHTRQGFYADPVYFGNRDHIGWEVIGFPGPRSMAEVLNGTYSTLQYFAETRTHPGTESNSG